MMLIQLLQSLLASVCLYLTLCTYSVELFTKWCPSVSVRSCFVCLGLDVCCLLRSSKTMTLFTEPLLHLIFPKKKKKSVKTDCGLLVTSSSSSSSHILILLVRSGVALPVVCLQCRTSTPPFHDCSHLCLPSQPAGLNYQDPVKSVLESMILRTDFAFDFRMFWSNTIRSDLARKPEYWNEFCLY